MKTAEHNLIAYRAAQLAIVYLTRREDVTVVACPQEDGLDVVIALQKQGCKNDARVGFVTKALAPETNGASSNQVARLRAVQKRLPETENFALPVCLFVFDMRDDNGYWRWLREPSADETNKHLQTNHEQTLIPLTNESINAIMDAVSHWYDAG